MTTRKELQDWLEQFPEETIIEFAFQQPPSNYVPFGPVEFKSPTLENEETGEGWSFIDYTLNSRLHPEHEMFGKKYLSLGEYY